MYCYHSSLSRFIFSFWLICFLLLINLGSFSVTLVMGVVGFLFNLKKKKQPSLMDPISMHIKFEGSTWNHLIILNVETFPYTWIVLLPIWSHETVMIKQNSVTCLRHGHFSMEIIFQRAAIRMVSLMEKEGTSSIPVRRHISL